MHVLSEHSVFIFVAQIGLILLFARIFGEIAHKLGQPVIVGEVFAGIILGPSVFGNFLPDLYRDLFPNTGHQPYLLQAVSWLCVIFLLMITGLEIDIRASLRQGKQSLYISILSLILTFIGTYIACQFLPEVLYTEGVNPVHVHLMTTISLSVVAIPVIAKILFDLKILRSNVGVNIITSGVLCDVWGWIAVAVIIAVISQGAFDAITILKPLITIVLYLGVTLSIGPKIVDKFFNFIGYKKMDTNVALSMLFALALLNGAIAHLLGIHVIFGAFVAGVMAGESNKISEYVRQSTQDFIFSIFAPIFFVLIGMQLQFSYLSNWQPLVLLLFVSSILRIGGAYLGAVFAKMGKHNAFAVACGLNTQGTMGIIIALIGYEMGVLNDAFFSLIVVICVVTSIGVGPLLKWAIRFVKRPLAQYFDKEHVFLDIEGGTKKEVIANIAKSMATRGLIDDHALIEQAIWKREATLSTAIGEGVALPHARIPNLEEPILCFFRLKNNVDFGSPDNKPVNLLFVELTDKDDEGMQLNLIAQVARFISSEENRQRLVQCHKEEEIHHILSFDAHA